MRLTAGIPGGHDTRRPGRRGCGLGPFRARTIDVHGISWKPAAVWRSRWLPLVAVAIVQSTSGCAKTAIKAAGDAPPYELVPQFGVDAARTSDGHPWTEDAPSPERDDAAEASDLRPDGPQAGAFDVAPRFDALDGPWAWVEDSPGIAVGDAPLGEVSSSTDVRPTRDIPGDPIKPPAEVVFSPDSAELADLCTRTGGRPTMVYCARLEEFFDTCTGLANCYMCKPFCADIPTCACPSGGCFKPPYGCVASRSGCTVGMDLTCNDNPALRVPLGECVEGGYCVCRDAVSNPESGKCM